MTRSRRQRGMALVEALIASALLTVGLLGATRLTLHALHVLRQTDQQTEAQDLAREALDCAIAGGLPCPAAPTVRRSGTDYRIALQQTPLGASLRQWQVTVQWTDTDSSTTTPRSLTWRSRASDLGSRLGVSSP